MRREEDDDDSGGGGCETRDKVNIQTHTNTAATAAQPKRSEEYRHNKIVSFLTHYTISLKS